MNAIRHEPIAIVGIGCRFPGAEHPQAFWELLCAGRHAIREVPAERWDVEALYSADPDLPGKMLSRWGGFIEHVDQFDWRMFRILPREARAIDPQHRLLLEVAWEALEDAGLPLAQVKGSLTSVSIGISWNDYLRLQLRNWSQVNGYTAVGNPYAFAANRLSYFFDFQGPSLALDNGCASSLSALYLACQSLWTGEATLALAGGVNLMLSPDSTIMMSKAGLLAADGRCKTLDACADGFVRGEGAGIVVLKPASLLEPTDRVYAFIREIGINHNGHNEWIMGASAAAQERLLRRVYEKAGIDPADVDYIELHGTGFLRGDALETGALGALFGSATRARPCAIGAVKTNLGNLEAAAGIASVIKVALSLYYRALPPTLNLQEVNPAIPLQKYHLQPQLTLAPWPEKTELPIAGVTTVSFTGVNAHAILSAAESLAASASVSLEEDVETTRVLLLSAGSRQALLEQAQSWHDFLLGCNPSAYSWRDVCYTACMRRNHLEHRLAITAHSLGEAEQALADFLQQKPAHNASYHAAQVLKNSRQVFLFGRRFSVWALTFLKQPEFRQAIMACDRLLQGGSNEQGLHDFIAGLDTLSSQQFIYEPKLVFALQLVLVSLWKSWGVTPTAVIGEGVGEITAAYVAEALSLEEALRLFSTQASGQSPWLVPLATVYARTPSLPIVSASAGYVSVEDIQHPSKEICLSADAHMSVTLTDQVVHEGPAVYIELGAPSALSGGILARLDHYTLPGAVLSSLHYGEEAMSVFLGLLGKLHTLGIAIDWSVFYPGGEHCVSLPTYRWQRERLWMDWLDVTTISTPPEAQHLDETSPPYPYPTSVHSSQVTEGEHIISLLRGLSAEKQREVLQSYILGLISTLLELDPATDTILPGTRLFEAGLDSLSAVQLIQRLQVQLECSLSVTLLFNYSTVERLTEFLLGRLFAVPFSNSEDNLPASPVEQDEPSGKEDKEDAADLTDEQVTQALMRKLAAIERRFT